MTQGLAPYQKVAFVCYVFLPVYIVLHFYLLPGTLPGWTIQIAYVAAGFLVIAFGIEAWKLISDYRAGRLFPIRNATFFVTLFSLAAVPLLGLYFWSSGEEFSLPILLLIPVFLYYSVINLFYVRVDNVSLRARTGFRAPLDVPLFGLDRLEVGEEEIVVGGGEGPGVRLLRGYFFPKDWQRLRARMRALEN